MASGRRAWLGLIVLCSLAMHLKGLLSEPLDYHYHRQVNTAAISRNYHENGLQFLKPQIDWLGGYRGRAATEFPLYMWLTGAFWSLAGLGAAWGRILSALFSALAALYLFILLEEDLGERAALFAALFFSFMPLEVYFGRTIQPEALALLGTLGAFYHWKRSLCAPRRWDHWLAASLFAFLAIAHKLPYAYVLGPLGFLAWQQLGWRALRDLKTLAALTLVLAGVGGWYYYASFGPYVVPTHGSEFKRMLDYGRLPYFLWFQFFSRLPELVLTYSGVALAGLGIRALRGKPQGRFYLVWGLCLAVYIVLGGGYTFHHEYTMLPFVPLCAALMGLGTCVLLDKTQALAQPSRSVAAMGLALLLIGVPLHAGLRIGHWYKQDHLFLAKAAEAAKRVSGPEDLFLGNERAASVFLYYLHRRGWGWDLGEAGESGLAQVEDVRREGASFFMTEKAGLFQDAAGVFARYFYDRYPVAYDQDGILIFDLRLKAPTTGRRAASGPISR